MAEWQNILITAWATQPTGALVDAFAQRATALFERYEKLSAAHVLLDGAAMPSAEARHALQALAERYRGRLACVGTVIAGTGFWASAMRGFVTGMHVIKARPANSTFVSSHDLAHWLAPQHGIATGVVCTAVELEHVIAAVLRQPSIRSHLRA